MTEGYLAEAEMSVQLGTLRSSMPNKANVGIRNSRLSSSRATSRLVSATNTANANSPETDATSQQQQASTKQSEAAKPRLSRHNGLLTPFCRRQISFMRNYKHSGRPGPLEEIEHTFPLMGLELQQLESNRSKCSQEQNAFRATQTSCFLKRFKSKQLRNRESRNNSFEEALTLQPKLYQLVQKPAHPKFFTNCHLADEERENDASLRCQSIRNEAFVVKKRKNIPVTRERTRLKTNSSRRNTCQFTYHDNDTLEPWKSDDVHPY